MEKYAKAALRATRKKKPPARTLRGLLGLVGRRRIYQSPMR